MKSKWYHVRHIFVLLAAGAGIAVLIPLMFLLCLVVAMFDGVRS